MDNVYSTYCSDTALVEDGVGGTLGLHSSLAATTWLYVAVATRNRHNRTGKVAPCAVAIVRLLVYASHTIKLAAVD